MLIVSVTLLLLVNKLPSVVSGIITGAGIGNAGTGNFGAGMAVGAAGMAAAAAATGGALLASGTANAAGGAHALTAAFARARENVDTGTDVLTSLWSGGGGAGEREAGMGDAPYARAAGYAPSSEAQTFGFGSAVKGDGQGGSARSPHKGALDEGAGKTGGARDRAGSGGTRHTEGGQPSRSGGLMSSVGNAGLIAADAAANLAKGTAQVAMEKIAGLKEAAGERIAETPGGKIAAALKGGEAKDGLGANEPAPVFTGNTLAGAEARDVDAAAEIAAFVNREPRSAWPRGREIEAGTPGEFGDGGNPSATD